MRTAKYLRLVPAAEFFCGCIMTPDKIVKRCRAHDTAEGLRQMRNTLSNSGQKCDFCGETWQLQLAFWTSLPAMWKCRMCGHEWFTDGEGKRV